MNLKWGKKVECPNCHKIFYDFGKSMLVCPGVDCHYKFSNKIDKERLNKIHDSEEENDLENDNENEFEENNSNNELSEEDEDETLTSNMKRIDKFINTVDD